MRNSVLFSGLLTAIVALVYIASSDVYAQVAVQKVESVRCPNSDCEPAAPCGRKDTKPEDSLRLFVPVSSFVVLQTIMRPSVRRSRVTNSTFCLWEIKGLDDVTPQRSTARISSRSYS
jgi:hypothetical protein